MRDLFAVNLQHVQGYKNHHGKQQCHANYCTPDYDTAGVLPFSGCSVHVGGYHILQ
jgi:hypothetical protein